MIASFKRNKKGIIMMVLSSLCVCIGQLFWKLSNFDNFLLYLIIGFALYGVGALLMIKAYSFGSLSVLQPILSINYIFTLLFGYAILSESISTTKLIGVLIITTGVFILGGSDND